MSSENANLGDFQSPTAPSLDRKSPYADAWNGGHHETQPSIDDECSECGAHVTPDFVRVFGSESGSVYACTECSRSPAWRNGLAADPERDERVQR